MCAPCSIKIDPILIVCVMASPFSIGEFLNDNPLTSGYERLTCRVQVCDTTGLECDRGVYPHGEGDHEWRDGNQEQQKHQVAGGSEHRQDGIKKQGRSDKSERPKILLCTQRPLNNHDGACTDHPIQQELVIGSSAPRHRGQQQTHHATPLDRFREHGNLISSGTGYVFAEPMGGRIWPPQQWTWLSSSDRDRNRDLVERRVANLKNADLRRALYHLFQGFHHLWVGVAAITVRILLLVP